MAWSVDELEMWIDRPVVDKGDNKLGTIVDVYMDDTTGNPEWLAIRINGLLTKRLSFVPLVGAAEDGNNVRVAYDKSTIKDSPSMSFDGDLSADEEARLYAHYGLALPGGASSQRTEGAEMQESGSNSVNNEMSPELARQRLMRRDEESIDFIDLDAQEKTRPKSDSSQ